MSGRILIAGAGYVGTHLARQLRAQGRDVWTLRRTPDPTDPRHLVGDLTQAAALHLPEPISQVIFCAGLKRAEPAAYEQLFITGLGQLLERLRPHPVQRWLFTSTTGVYHELEGGWVDEETPPRPARPPARYYLAAEELFARHGVPHVIARLSGIYGPGRTRLLESVLAGTARRDPGPVRYLNHIHIEDIAGALIHLLTHPAPAQVYNVTDNEPANRNEMLAWIADQSGQPQPPLAVAAAEPPRGGNKRCANRRLRESGYQLVYPTYREGYAQLLAQCRHRPPGTSGQ
jgi:nucleoside-diphosphate-sugar epimerase